MRRTHNKLAHLLLIVRRNNEKISPLLAFGAAN
jgi:hypothetical protein